MTNIFWKSSLKDKAKNGLVAGGIAGALIYFGAEIKTFALMNIPSKWLLGDISILGYFIVIGALAGYIIDKW